MRIVASFNHKNKLYMTHVGCSLLHVTVCSLLTLLYVHGMLVVYCFIQTHIFPFYTATVIISVES